MDYCPRCGGRLVVFGPLTNGVTVNVCTLGCWIVFKKNGYKFTCNIDAEGYYGNELHRWTELFGLTEENAMIREGGSHK